jgi:hypothetical protein
MSGPQVIEVVVIDSDISDTDEGKGEPDVTVNGKDLRMVQAVDGNWYAYFADVTMAVTADTTVALAAAGDGLDFGAFCSKDTAGALITDPAVNDIDFSDTSGVAVKAVPVGSGADPNPANEAAVVAATCVSVTNAAWTAAGTTANLLNNVVRESKDVNANTAANTAPATGQIGVDANAWPFVQLYPLNPTGNVVVQYNKGGGIQTTTLSFDTVDHLASAELDRTIFPRGAQIHATISDVWLNIDPTDEDSWTWNTVTGDAYYQVFDENGGNPATGETATDFDLTAALKSSLMCEDNCTLLVNSDQQSTGTPVLTIQDNKDTVTLPVPATTAAAANIATVAGLGAGTAPVTVTGTVPAPRPTTVATLAAAAVVAGTGNVTVSALS